MFDCLNGDIQERLLETACFSGKNAAIEMARDLEATLLEICYSNNVIEWTEVVYDPYNFFSNVGGMK